MTKLDSTPTALVMGVGATATILSRGEETAGACAVILGVMEPGLSGPPLHRHRGFSEVYIVLDGALELTVGDRTITLGPKGSATVPVGVAHAFRTVGDRPCRFLNIYAPGGFERYLEEAAAAMRPDRPFDPALLARIATRYDMELVEPARAR